MEGKVASFVITEKLTVSYGGATYILETKQEEGLFKGMKLSKEELMEIKKLPCDLKTHLFALSLFKGKIKEVLAVEQESFNL